MVKAASTISVPARISVPSGAASARSMVQVPLPCLTSVPLLVTVPVTARLNNCWPTPSRMSVELVVPLRARLPLILLPVEQLNSIRSAANVTLPLMVPELTTVTAFSGPSMHAVIERSGIIQDPACDKHHFIRQCHTRQDHERAIEHLHEASAKGAVAAGHQRSRENVGAAAVRIVGVAQDNRALVIGIADRQGVSAGDDTSISCRSVDRCGQGVGAAERNQGDGSWGSRRWRWSTIRRRSR